MGVARAYELNTMTSVVASAPLTQQTAQIDALSTREREHGRNHAQAFSNRVDLLQPARKTTAIPTVTVSSKAADPQQQPTSVSTVQRSNQQKPSQPAENVNGTRKSGINNELVPSRLATSTHKTAPEEGNWEVRHGFEDQYASHQYLELLNSVSLLSSQPKV